MPGLSVTSTFFERLDVLVRDSTIVIERPARTPHPRIPTVVYPVDYGSLDGTTSADGAGIDVFVGTESGRGVLGVALTADLAKKDVEVKVLLDCSDDERDAVLALLANELEIGGHWVPRPST